MKARGITVAWSQNLQNLAMYAKGKGLLMPKRKALDFCKMFPRETIFYWEEKHILEGETREIRFVLKKAVFCTINQFIEMKKNKSLNKWICTDPGTNQWGRMIRPGVYEFKEDITLPDGTKIKKRDEVDLSEYTEEKKQEALSAYGYDGSTDWGDDKDWITAECLFELNDDCLL